MSIQYSITIDHDGSFEQEIRSEVLALEWRLGMAGVHDSMAAPSWARITLRNPHGQFSPERQPLAIGARLRIESIDKGRVQRHFTGIISWVEPEAGTQGKKRATIHLQDILPWLESSQARLPPQVDVRADEVIAALLDSVPLRRARIAGFCIIDAAGYNDIDSVRIFPPQQIAMRLQPGKSRFAYVGDWWDETTTVREAIAEMAASERGKFYINSAGEPVFLNRHHSLVQRRIAAQIDDSMVAMRYSYGDDRLNRVYLRMRPRSIGLPQSLLWTFTGELRFAAGKELRMTLRPLDDKGEPVGVLALDRLVSRFRIARAGGATVSENVVAEALQINTNTVEIRLSNRRREALFLTSLQLYGQVISHSTMLEVVAEDALGVHLHGVKQATLELPALSDIETAQAFVDYELALRKSPRGTVQSLQLDLRQGPLLARQASLFDRIRISERQTGHIAHDYFIIAEQHEVSAGGQQHKVTWTLEPADAARFVLINSSLIDAADEQLAPF